MYELQVDNMSCAHCVRAVTKAVRALDTQATVEVDLAAKTVKVASAVALAQISAAIVEAGYPLAAER